MWITAVSFHSQIQARESQYHALFSFKILKSHSAMANYLHFSYQF